MGRANSKPLVVVIALVALLAVVGAIAWVATAFLKKTS